MSGDYVPRERIHYRRCPGCGGNVVDAEGFSAHLLVSHACADACEYIIVGDIRVIDGSIWIEPKASGGASGNWRVIYAVACGGYKVELARFKKAKEAQAFARKAE